ncbi:MAG TPA: phosphatase PAP2 family protein [Gaiellaceae bacterium]|nr:phosphatase PAP2 family protein [Gaiellaceae bacterium]
MQHRWPPLDDVFVWLTRLGSHGAIWFAIAFVLALLRRDVRTFVLVAIAVLAADGLAGLVKIAVHEHRPRGTHPLVAIPHSGSFPSGHTATAFAAATMLTAIAPRGAAAWIVLAAAIAYSRLYVGVHYPLDVAGGIAIGVVTALLLRAAARRGSPRSRRRG